MEQDLKIVSFKDVQKELELESNFLNKTHDVYDFKRKYDLLNAMGFGNTIAARIYNDISKNSHEIAKYQMNYPFHKFILPSQLERVCEKYNLYVRSTELYMGDIPLKNIEDIKSFGISIDDLIGEKLNLFRGVNDLEELMDKEYPELGYTRLGRTRKYTFEELNKTSEFARFLVSVYKDNTSIAAVRGLFSEKAFERTEARIINKEQIAPKSQVDMDPIVLHKVPGGYLIVTAWGDEANDELVVKENLN